MSLLVVDGYNVIHAWPQTKQRLQHAGLEEARRLLLVRLAEYAAVRSLRVEVVFDGPRRDVVAPVELVDGVSVRFSGGHGGADAVIERLVYDELRRPGAAVRVATGDRLQRDVVRAMGADTVDGAGLLAEVTAALTEIAHDARRLRDLAGRFRRVEGQLPPEVLRDLEALRRGQPLPGTAGGGESDTPVLG